RHRALRHGADVGGLVLVVRMAVVGAVGRGWGHSASFGDTDSRMRIREATRRGSRRSTHGLGGGRPVGSGVVITLRAGRSGSTCRKMYDVATMASAISQAGKSSILNVNR